MDLDVDTETLPFSIQNRDQHAIDWNDPGNAYVKFPRRLANAFFANAWCSDVTIHIPKDNHNVPAHSLILSAASPVLEDIFFGSRPIPGNRRIITVPDYCSTEVLLIVLRYLYVGTEAEGLNRANAIQVLKMADYFDLRQLQIQCENLIIEDTPSDDTVCSVFNGIHSIDSDLVTVYMEYMQCHTQEILSNGSAMQMEDAALFKLLCLDRALSIANELTIVRSMIDWADEQCLRRSIEETPQNRRMVLGDRTKCIRFGSMTLEDFRESVNLFGNGFFTSEEFALTYQQIDASTNGTMNQPREYPFSGVPRQHRRRFGDYCMTSHSRRSAEWRFTIDVSHMKRPFQLNRIRILDNKLLEIDSITSDDVSPIQYSIAIDHGVPMVAFDGAGIGPNQRNIISLRITFSSPVKGSKIRIKQPPFQPNLLEEFTCVTSIVYTCNE